MKKQTVQKFSVHGSEVGRKPRAVIFWRLLCELYQRPVMFPISTCYDQAAVVARRLGESPRMTLSTARRLLKRDTRLTARRRGAVFALPILLLLASLQSTASLHAAARPLYPDSTALHETGHRQFLPLRLPTNMFPARELPTLFGACVGSADLCRGDAATPKETLWCAALPETQFYGAVSCRFHQTFSAPPVCGFGFPHCQCLARLPQRGAVLK
jgi:hypothetical protein